MKTTHIILKKLVTASFLLLAFMATSQITSAATYYLDFYSTTVAAGSGPVNPTNGVVAIYGTNLTAGDVVVFDGVAVSQTPGTGDQWAAINLNAGGFHGVTGATLGVKAETANGTGNSQLFPFSSSFGDVGATTNHVRVELTVTTTGSTTNMTYVAKTDPNFTGTFYPLSGSGLTFPNNIIPLTFGAQAQGQAFYDTSGKLSITATPASSDPLLAGNTTTFTAIYQGPPSCTFQWLSNNVPITGAHSLTYTPPPITAANNGDHYAMILLTNSVNALTSAPCVLNYHAGPATWVFNFAPTNFTAGSGAFWTTPNISTITNLANFAPGDTVVFDGIVTGNGAWGGPAINSFGGITAAGMGVLLRFGLNGQGGAIYTNSVSANYNNITTAAAATNHLRIELYISTQGSLTNMGWKVLLDQNLTGTYSITQTGTNLTFNATSLWLQFQNQNSSSISFGQNQTLTTYGYTGGPFAYNGSGLSPTISYSGSTGAKTTNYVGTGSTVYSSVNSPGNAGTYYVSNTVAADANYLGATNSQAFTIQQATSATTTVGAGPFTYDGTTHAGGSGTVTGAGGLSTAATSLTYSGDQIDAGSYTVTAHYAGDANHTASDGAAVTITIQKATSSTTTVGAGPFTYDGTTHAGGSGTVTGAGGLSTGATSLTYSGSQINAGSYTVTAHYAGDANHTASDGAAVGITINAAATTFSRLSSLTKSYGVTHIILTGGVSAAGPVYPASGEVVRATINGFPVSGTVTNSTGDFAINYNDPSLATNGVARSPYTITYNYAGNLNLAAATADTSTTLTINRAITVVGAASSGNPSGYKAAITFTATLPADATGSVVFSSTIGDFSTNSVSNGSATSLSITNLPRGTNLIAVGFAGDSNYLGYTNTLNQIVTNHPPVVNAASYTRNAVIQTMEIAVTNLLSAASDLDGDTLTLASVSPTTNSATLTVSGGWILYYNTNAVADQFTYTVSDGFGGTNSATVTLTVANTPLFGQSQVASTSDGTATLKFAGIPGYSYSVLRTTNLTSSWTAIWTTNAPVSGAFQYIDLSAPLPSAYYQLQYNP